MTPPPPERPSLARLATRGALWTGFAQYLWFALGIVKAVWLARIIGRPYFGLIAGATVWASFLGFARLDLRVATLGSREEPEVLDTQFLIENLAAFSGLVLAGIVAAGWPGLASPTVWWLIFILLLAAQAEALTSTHVYLTEKRLRQDVLGRFTAVSAIVSFVLAITLALRGAALAALVVDAVVPVLLPRLGAVFFVRWRPRLVWHAAQVRAQVRLAWTLWTSGLLGKITYQLDDWLVFNLRRTGPVLWRGAGVEAEALYDRAYSIGKMPMDLAAGMIASNALALYVEGAARGPEAVAGIYRRLTWLLSWIIFFSGAYVFVAAEDLVHVLGDQWVPMVPLLRLMILFVVGRPLFQNNAQLLLAARRERELRRAIAVQAAVMVVACLPAVHFFGAAGAAVVTSVMSVVGLASSERFLQRCLGIASWPLYLRPAGAALLTVGMVEIFRSSLPANIWVCAAVKGAWTCLVFGAAVWYLDRPGAAESWRTFRRGLREA